jgi:hypothetical protein
VFTLSVLTGESAGSWVGAGEENPGVQGTGNEGIEESSADVVQGVSTRSTVECPQDTNDDMLKSYSIDLDNDVPCRFELNPAIPVARGPENP